MMNCWIQYQNGRPYSPSAWILERGFYKLSWVTQPFTLDQLDTDEKVLTGNAYVAGVETNLKIAGRRQVAYDAIPDYPDELRPVLHREIRQTTLAEALLSIPIFVKPLEQKLFVGRVVNNGAEGTRLLQEWGETMIVLSFQIVSFIAEYRVYVLAGLVLNVARYRGDWSAQPDPEVIRRMIRAFHSAPISYSLDVGVDALGRTVLVEVNDPLGMVNYGLAPESHARMVATRWLWMLNQLDAGKILASQEEAPPFVW